MNVLKEIANSIHDISDRQYKVLEEKYKKKKTESEYWKELEKSAEDWAKFANNPEYPSIMKFFEETKERLQDIQDAILSGNFKNYTREERTDKAAILAGQKLILKLLINEPKRINKELKNRGEIA